MSTPPLLRDPIYLGDGVYGGRDSHGRTWIYLDDGLRKSSAICLEPEVLDSLIEYATPVTDDELEAAIEAGWSCREDFESDSFGEERLRRIIRARRKR